MEIDVEGIKEQIHKLNRVIPYCRTRKEANEIMEEITELEEQLPIE